MKKTTLASLLLAVPLMIGGAASAATLGTYTHNYGTGQVDPGGSDILGSGFVIVSDQSATRFSDFFDFSALSFDSVSSFDLTLTYSEVGDKPSLSTFFLAGENWSVRPGGIVSYGAFNLPANSSSATFTIDSLNASTTAGLNGTFAQMAAAKNFYFWFAEDSARSDDFRLNSATLTVNGVSPVPEPETYALMLAGLSLMGAIARRRKGKQA